MHFVIFCITLLFFPLDLYAQTITENIPLSFGRVVLVDNSVSRDIELLPSGSYVADSAYIFFSEPRLASVTVDGCTPLTPLLINVNATNLRASGGGAAFFSTGDTFTNPAIVITDLTGSATFEIDATLSSNGSGAGFIDSDYTGTYTISVTE